MDAVDIAGQEVLASYGLFSERLGDNYNRLKCQLLPTNEDFYRPMTLKMITKDHTYIHEKIDVDKSVQNRILIAFTAICNEVKSLKNELETDYLNAILRYGDDCIDRNDADGTQVVACKFLPKLLDVMNFIRRCHSVISHILQQLVSYYEFLKKNATVAPVNLTFIFSCLGDLLSMLVTLDLTFEEYNDNLIKTHFLALDKTVQSLIDDERLYETNLSEMKSIISEVLYLLNGNIFKSSLNMYLNSRSSIEYLNFFKSHLNIYLKNTLDMELTKENDVCSWQVASNVIICHVFGVSLCGITNKKIHNQVVELAKKNAVLPLCKSVVWLPQKFLSKHLDSKLGDAKSKLTVERAVLQKYLDAAVMNLSKEVKLLALKVYKWALQMENTLSPDSINLKLNDINTANLCPEGLDISRAIQFSANQLVYLHNFLGNPMTKGTALNLCKLVELAKAIQSVFSRHHFAISRRLNHVVQRIQIQALCLITGAKRELVKDKQCPPNKIDFYSALSMVEKLLHDACIDDNMLLIRLALAFVEGEQAYSFEREIFSVQKLLNKLRCLCDMRVEIEEVVDFNFVLSGLNMLPIYFKHNIDNQMNMTRFQYVLDPVLKTDEDPLFDQSKGCLELIVLPQLNQLVETNLRLHAHCHLQDPSPPILISHDLRLILRTPSLTLSSSRINIRELVEYYLDKTFFDLATVALHDWQTYREMKSLAEYKFNLMLTEDYLPSQTLSQGLDILEIMRKIHTFVSKYTYNLNNQCFIEGSSCSKNLNIIKICQISNSIRTHGVGIMNTTTNLIYQFLKKKMVVFSKFLYDDTIRSRLMKDLNDIKSHQLAFYPYDKAQRFVTSIAKLGTSAEGLTFLDQYRQLITQIGNALGYVRMVYAGGLHYCLECSSYVPNSRTVELNKEDLKAIGAEVVSSFDSILNSLIQNLAESNEYFKLLVEVFSTFVKSSENSHLKLFSVVIPPLTLNYIAHIVTAKEKMVKRSKNSVMFTDDGFVLGVAYLLNVLNLNEEFNSLYWFESVNQKYKDEEKRRSGSYDDDKHAPNDNTIKLSLRIMQLYKKEFELLHFNLNSARAFF